MFFLFSFPAPGEGDNLAISCSSRAAFNDLDQLPKLEEKVTGAKAELKTISDTILKNKQELVNQEARLKKCQNEVKAKVTVHASRRKGWISSSFANPKILTDFAEIILEVGEVDLEKQLHPFPPWGS